MSLNLNVNPDGSGSAPNPHNVGAVEANSRPKRTRSGCKTCRARKLKCDEQRPVCGQCRKSNRQCIPSEGVAFRHAQNAGMSSAANSLENFYKYRQTFKQDQFFLPIAPQLRFVHVTDPYADDNALSNPDYQRVAAHSLEALSTAASDNSHANDASLNSFDDFTHDLYTHSAGHMRRQGGSLSHLHNQNNDIGFLLNPSSNTPSALIDPNLEVSHDHDHDLAHELQQHHEDGLDVGDGSKLDGAQIEEQVLAALQSTAESLGGSA